MGGGFYVSIPKPVRSAFDDGYGGYDQFEISVRPSGSIINPINENIVYFVSSQTTGRNKVFSLNIATGVESIVATDIFGTEINGNSQQIAISHDGQFLYVTSGWSTDVLVSKVEIATGTSTHLIELYDDLGNPLPGNPNYITDNPEVTSVTINEDDSKLYLTAQDDIVLFEFDLGEGIDYGNRFHFLVARDSACTYFALNCSGGRNLGSISAYASFLNKYNNDLIMVDNWNEIYTLNVNETDSGYLTFTKILDVDTSEDSSQYYAATRDQNYYYIAHKSRSTQHHQVQKIAAAGLPGTVNVVDTFDLGSGFSFGNAYNSGFTLGNNGPKLVMASDYATLPYKIFSLNLLPDSVVPNFEYLLPPNSTQKINITNNQIIHASPLNVKTKPTDASGIQKVEYYLDTILIATDTTADANGVYESNLDMNLAQNKPGGLTLKAKAYDNYQNTAEYTVNIIPDPLIFGYQTLLSNPDINSPSGIAIDPSNNNIFYVASDNPKQIYKVVYENGNYNFSPLTSETYKTNQMITDAAGDYLYLGVWGDFSGLIKINIKEGTPEYGNVETLVNYNSNDVPVEIDHNTWTPAVILSQNEDRLIFAPEQPRAIYSFDLTTHEFVKIAGGGLAGVDGKGELAGFSYISYFGKYDNNNILITDNWTKLRKLNINPQSSDYGLVTTLLTAFYNEGGMVKHPNLNQLYFTTNSPNQNWPYDVNLMNLSNYNLVSGFNISPSGAHFSEGYSSGIDVSADTKILVATDWNNAKIFIQRYLDVFAPESITLSPTAGTTGDTVNFTATAWDNDAPTRAEISIDGGAFVNLPRTSLNNGTGTFVGSVTLPHKTSVSYTLKVYDTANNVGTKTGTISIADNDKPSINKVEPLTGTTGDVTTLAVTTSDNIAVTKHQISVNSAPYVDMTSTTYDLNVPFNSIEPIKVKIKAFDAAGNFAESEEYIVTVTDNDPPEIIDFTPPTELSIDKNIISVTATDNIVPTKGTISLDGLIFEDMTGSISPFTYSLAENQLKDKESIAYTIRVYDAAGNYASTDKSESKVVAVPEEKPKSFIEKVRDFFNPKKVGAKVLGAFAAVGDAFIKMVENTPPAVANTFPYILFALLGVMALVFFYQAQSEARQARKLLEILRFEKVIYEDKENFLTLSAHYLRTPATLIVNGVDLLPVSKQKDKKILGPIAKNLSNEVQSILKEISDNTYLSSIKKPEIKKKRLSLFLSPFLLLPIVLVGIIAVVANMLFINVAKIDISTVNLAAEIMTFFIVLFVFITFARHRYTEKRNRQEFELTIGYERAMDNARNKFVADTIERLTPFVSDIDKNTPKSQDKITGSIQEGRKRLSDILYKFSLFAESSKGRFKLLNPRTVSLKTQANAALSVNEDQVKEKKLKIKDNLGNLQIKTDPKKIEFIVAALISNAVKFSKPSTEITIDAHKRGPKTEITVTDHGPGISEEEMLHLFKPFTRTSNALDFNYEGFGLSLYLSKILVNSLGGDVSLDSKVDKGTTVRVVV